MKSCMDFINFITKKMYTQYDSYRIGFCIAFGKDLDFYEFENILNDAEYCGGYAEEEYGYSCGESRLSGIEVGNG